MISNQIIKSSIEKLKEITKIDFSVRGTDGSVAASTQGSEDVQEAIPDEENPLAGPSSTLRSDAVGSSIELQGNVLLGMISFLTILMLFLVLYRDKDEGMDE